MKLLRKINFPNYPIYMYLVPLLTLTYIIIIVMPNCYVTM